MTPLELDADRILALSYVPARSRPGLTALWRLDVALGAVLAGGREPMISQIKLAWWRDSLAKLDHAPAPGEPVLQAVAEHILPAGIRGADLALMEEGWTALLTPEALGDADLRAYAASRGARLFLYSAQLLGVSPGEDIKEAGEAWALIDLARHSANAADVDAALAAARQRALPRQWPAHLRPLGMLAALAKRDSEPDRPRWEQQGAPGRMLRMLRHRFTGRL